MKPKLFTVHWILFTGLLAAASLHAQVSPYINYQGKLVIGGKPLQTTTEITFTIFGTATGGTALWSEKQLVTPSNGIFNVFLGSVTPFPRDLFTGTEQRWLALNVGNNPPLGQRTQITSVAYALKANSANALDAPDGIPTNAVFVDNDGNVGIGTLTPKALLTLNSTEPRIQFQDSGIDRAVINYEDNTGLDIGTQSHLADRSVHIQTQGARRVTVDENGKVGIGTTSPNYQLEIRRDINSETGIALKNRATISSGTSQSITFEGFRDVEQIYRVAKISVFHKPGNSGDLNQGADMAFYTNPGAGNNELTERMRIDQQGKVGIGTSSPGARLEVAGDICGKVITCPSSRRWKTNIQPIEGALEKVQRLRGVSYVWKEDGKPNLGLIAEEVAEVIPEVVSFEENGKDARAIDYSRLVAVLIEGMKEQQKTISDLQSRLEAVEEKQK